MAIDFGFFWIILASAPSEFCSLLEEQPDAVLAELATVVDQQRLVHGPPRPGLVAAPLGFERLGEQSIVRCLGEDRRVALDERVGAFEVAYGDGGERSG
jgi:hypothetical protein